MGPLWVSAAGAVWCRPTDAFPPCAASLLCGGADPRVLQDFCFIIRAGRCDVLVELNESQSAAPGASQSAAPGASPSQAAAPRADPSTPSDTASPAAARATGDDSKGEASAVQAAAAAKLAKRRKNLLLASAAAFKGTSDPAAPPLRANMRHIVTLRPGAIVGEIALFKDGVKRMATVRTADSAELLILDKKSFLDLDRATLNIISENARYNAACTKEPGQRTRDDLQILRQRTAHLSHMSSLSTEVHLELCRVMRYRKVNEHTLLARKGMPASCLIVIISGSAASHVQEPRQRKWSTMGLAGLAGAAKAKRAASVEAYAGMKPNEVLHAGQAIGEDELLLENPVHGCTVITAEPVELMEIERQDFDRILKADRTSEKGKLIDFLTSLSMTSCLSVAGIHALSNCTSRRTFMKDQLCLVHPPDPFLGAFSFSYDYVYLIYSGEARLVCSYDDRIDYDTAPVIDAAAPAFGPLVDSKQPPLRKIERHIGTPLVSVATLGPGECVSDNLLAKPGARWALKPITQLELIILPRKDWADTLRLGVVAELRELAKVKAAFFQQTLNENAARLLDHVVSASPRGLRGVGSSATIASPMRKSGMAQSPVSTAGSLPPLRKSGTADNRSQSLPASPLRKSELRKSDSQPPSPPASLRSTLDPAAATHRAASPRKYVAEATPSASAPTAGVKTDRIVIRSSAMGMRPLHS